MTVMATSVLFVLVVMLSLSTIILLVDNKWHRKEVSRLLKDIEQRDKDDQDEGTVVLVEYADGYSTRIQGVRKITKDKQGVVLRAANDCIVAVINSEQLKSICAEHALQIEEETE